MIVGLADVELHPGIAQTEVSQHVDQYGIGEGDGRGEADETADVPLLALDLAGRLLDFGQRRAQALVIAQPLVGEAQLAGRSVQQGAPELFFQL